MKTLYYPRLVADDFYTLNYFFEEQYKNSLNRTRLNYGLSLLSLVGAWGLSYTLRFKKTTFGVVSLFSTFASFKLLENLNEKNMQNRLNNKAYDVAVKYPEIKFSKVVYTKSEEVSKRTLPLF